MTNKSDFLAKNFFSPALDGKVYLKVYIFQSKSYKEMGRLDKLLIIVDCGHVRHYGESICIRIRHKEAGGSLLTLSMSNCQLCTCTT